MGELNSPNTLLGMNESRQCKMAADEPEMHKHARFFRIVRIF